MESGKATLKAREAEIDGNNVGVDAFDRRLPGGRDVLRTDGRSQ
ncbi:hypothetical protein ACWERY_11250 [Streptomyces sp. NPDC004082]